MRVRNGAPARMTLEIAENGVLLVAEGAGSGHHTTPQRTAVIYTSFATLVDELEEVLLGDTSQAVDT
mgnify:CR=1 FL=1